MFVGSSSEDSDREGEEDREVGLEEGRLPAGDRTKACRISDFLASNSAMVVSSVPKAAIGGVLGSSSILLGGSKGGMGVSAWGRLSSEEEGA